MLTEARIVQKKKKMVSYGFAKRHGIIVVEIFRDYATAIYHSGTIPEAIIELRRYLDMPILFEEVNLEYFNTQLTKQYEQQTKDALQVAEDMGESIELDDVIQSMPHSADLMEAESDAPVIRLINALLREAIKKTASDIHFETYEKAVSVRLRIDGVLQNVLQVPPSLAPLIISRIKVMAKLDISEKRLPQDGRISVKMADRAIDVRVSTIPVSHGERIVMRLLDKKNVHLNLTDLGISGFLLSIILRMIAKPHGIILVTGPTGSGKTTTLYAILSKLNTPGRNIMTIEDPIEYDLLGIAQTQVNPKVEMNFARGLRAILRQDPNVVMVGEIRDAETAMISIQASLTGHLVLSTLHTNTAIGAVTRLLDMGIESFLLSSSLIGLISQRLIRLLCQYCKTSYEASDEQCDALGIPKESKPQLYQASGCIHCHQSGYSGRVGVYEVIEVDNTLRSMIHRLDSEQQMETYCRQKTPSILEDGVQRVLDGETSFEEVMRIINI